MSTVPAVQSFERVDLAQTERITPEQFRESFNLADVPSAPGCYIMRDEKDRVIYVGKAKSLRMRVRTYLGEGDGRYTVKFLMKRVSKIDFLVTTNEKEALLLENSLIKEHHPRYNVQLKDDKSYVSVRVNVTHQWPRVTVTRKLRKDGSRYFGPYASAAATRHTIKQLQRSFPLRLCSDSVLRSRTRPCLYYQMKQCSAPCVNLIDKDSYREIVNQALMALEGRNAELEKMLLAQIAEHAARMEYEKAAVLRDRVFDVRKTLERQRTVRQEPGDDQDIWGFFAEGRFSEVQVIFFRAGKMTGGRSFSYNQRELPIEELLGSFLLQYYADIPEPPSEILIPVEMEDAEALSEILTEKRGGRVTVHWPQRGEKRALIDIAARNAKSSFDEKRLAEHAKRDTLVQIKSVLKLTKEPNRIECFDISTIQGTSPVGSMVTFDAGMPNKSRYRRYKIKTVEGQDDFAMMREMLLRRFKRAVEEQDLPDFVLIDGGKGQLNVAVTVFKDLGIEDMEVAGIAKSRALESGDHSPERFFLPGIKDPIIVAQNSPMVKLIAQIRDEAHRFAVSYHRKRRTQAALTSPLATIPGVGPKRVRVLLNKIGSLAKVNAASVEEIAALPGFSTALAAQVKEHVALLHGGAK